MAPIDSKNNLLNELKENFLVLNEVKKPAERNLLINTITDKLKIGINNLKIAPVSNKDYPDVLNTIILYYIVIIQPSYHATVKDKALKKLIFDCMEHQGILAKNGNIDDDALYEKIKNCINDYFPPANHEAKVLKKKNTSF